MMTVTAVLALLGVTSVAAMYGGTDVVDLTPTNFQREVMKSDNVWIVEFYAPWCGHCQRLTPEYKKAASALKGVVKLGAVNADEHRSLCGQYGIQGFPTIKIFGKNKNKPEDYQGSRDAKSSSEPGGGKDVIELTEGNWKKKVLNNEKGILVEFFAPWCGHCKSLAGPWADAATQLKGKMDLGALDATAHPSIGQQYGVQGYPTIKYFAPGSSEPEDYNGGRSASDIVKFAEEKFSENLPAPEVVQITGSKSVEAACENHPLCVIAFLPHILDCQSDCRNGHIEDMKKLGDKYKKKDWGWLWSEGMAQPDLEGAVEVGGFGYPAMVVLSHKKMKYSTLAGSFSYDGINEFLRDLSYGKGRTNPVKGAKIPKIADVEGWDGKDGELPEEEDIDLSDVDLDDH